MAKRKFTFKRLKGYQYLHKPESLIFSETVLVNGPGVRDVTVRIDVRPIDFFGEVETVVAHRASDRTGTITDSLQHITYLSRTRKVLFGASSIKRIRLSVTNPKLATLRMLRRISRVSESLPTEV